MGLFLVDFKRDNFTVKILGIAWHAMSDIFVIKTKLSETKKVTKRSVLSNIAHSLDPFGLLSPVTAGGKIFMQTGMSVKKISKFWKSKKYIITL